MLIYRLSIIFSILSPTPRWVGLVQKIWDCFTHFLSQTDCPLRLNHSFKILTAPKPYNDDCMIQSQKKRKLPDSNIIQCKLSRYSVNLKIVKFATKVHKTTHSTPLLVKERIWNCVWQNMYLQHKTHFWMIRLSKDFSDHLDKFSDHLDHQDTFRIIRTLCKPSADILYLITHKTFQIFSGWS